MVQEIHGVDRRRFLAGAAATLGGAAVAGGAFPATAAHADPGTGPVAVGANDPQYPDLIMGLNNRWVAAPGSVHVVDAPGQIAPIVQAAVISGSRLTVRSGGHCFEDFVYNSDVNKIIDLTNMNKIYYDSTLNGIAVESGAILLDAYEKLYQTWGVIVPGGVCYSVGMGGHVAGGGWGWLVRRNGLIIDHLYAVEVVVVDASGKVRTIVATREQSDPHRALWWAHTGGGGGNFGIVTRYIFRSPGATGTDPRFLLPRPPATVLSSFTQWSWNDLDQASFNRLLLNYANYHVATKSPSSPTRNLVGLIQMFTRTNGSIQLYAAVDTAAPNAQQLLDDFLGYLKDGVVAPQFSVQTTTPWLQFAKQTGTTNVLNNDPTLRGEYKSAYFKAAFQPSHLAGLYNAMSRTDVGNPNLNLVISPYGGMTNAVAASATAMPHRDAAFKLLWQAQWNSPADDAKNIAWARDTYRETFADTGGVPVPNGVTDGCYVNYADADLSDPAFNQSSSTWHDLYYKENYPLLQSVKKAYDPRNFFRHRQSVQLPS